ncbi:hypothetical protein [Acidomonas methanolica]|uniref:Uncharacterized protein n=1 Tax=Acidomonas methanolica NBRC 104435 TaxID=1231351 RepID=A0A023D420_ACIMT|nr:hypothetical protein [Acidomonas methanolica]GAJ28908.1 hypothetical protein Amme_038_157 [Acidomonas methanolica NBRC 104435]GBQ55102.1 hypothetical protein AA0498_2212 [Acidomonas methanolica]GEK98112.1 hypothetical protein AME01nite_06110 [Acidomonas methanolica NBRC 104435]
MTDCPLPSRPARIMSRVLPRACGLVGTLALGGCFSIGPGRLTHDQLDYSRALGETQKHEMLLNIVRIRYADPPTFLDTTQVIAGYQLSRTLNGGFYAYPAAVTSYLFGSGSATMQETPTFTYQPETGQQYAENVVRPISPVVVMPLSLGGLPIDSLLRLTAQSIDGLSNVRALGAGPGGGGSLKFYLLLHDLRQLQVAGAMTIRIATDPPKGGQADDHDKSDSAHGGTGSGSGGANGVEHAFLVLPATSDPALASIQAEVRRLLMLSPHAEEAEIVYGPYPKVPGQIAILTRSMFAILSQIAYEIIVPDEDVTSGRTPPTISPVGIETRPDVVVHSGKELPDDIYTGVKYRNRWFWIEDSDFHSKLSFTMIQILAALAATSHSPGAVITIPAN